MPWVVLPVATAPTSAVSDSVTTVVADAGIIAGGVAAISNLINGKTPPTTIPVPTTTTPTPVAGISIGAVVVVGLAAVALWFFLRKS